MEDIDYFIIEKKNTIYSDDSWYVLVDGDLHYGDTIENNIPLPRSGKKNTINNINNVSQKYKLDFIINTGDLCSHGYDNKCIFPFCCIKNGNIDEFDTYIKEYYNPIINSGYKLYLTCGNHDTYVEWPYYRKPVLKFIKEKHNATYNIFNWKTSGCYTFEHNGILFINMGVYPSNLEFLQNILSKIDNKKPIVFIYHFVTPNNVPYGDWWSDDEKNDFFNIINKYNVLLIINGHDHETRIDYWNNIPCIIGSGDNSYMLLEFRKDNFISYKIINF